MWPKRVALAGVGVAAIGLASLSATHWENGPVSSGDGKILRAAPLNALGVAARWTAMMPIPRPVRKTVYSSYCSAMGCDVSEVQGKLEDFRSLAHFLDRSLRPETRPIDKGAPLIMPCDGTVVAAGPVGPYGSIEVKGIRYPIRELVGAADREPLAVTAVAVDEKVESGSRLWYAVIHIGPGDCHRFASPTTWTLKERRHIEGYLLWMNPNIEGLYTQNERVALLGSWMYGLLAMAAVGAAGRGSICLAPEEEEREVFRPKMRPVHEAVSRRQYGTAVHLQHGQEMGRFIVGSACVLVFEAPEKGFQFLAKPGDRVRQGEKLASVSTAEKHVAATRKPSETLESHLESSSRARFRRAW